MASCLMLLAAVSPVAAEENDDTGGGIDPAEVAEGCRSLRDRFNRTIDELSDLQHGPTVGLFLIVTFGMGIIDLAKRQNRIYSDQGILRDAWDVLGCTDAFGQIVGREKWTGAPSVWGVKSFDATDLLVGDFVSTRADDLIAVSRSAVTGRPELHVAARPLTPPMDGSSRFDSYPLVDPVLYALAGTMAYPGVRTLAGDFDGNGKDDIALTGGVDWHQVQVAFKSSSGWSLPVPDPWVVPPGGTQVFPLFVRQAGTKYTVGDFNGDGRDDIVAMNNAWTYLRVARSQSQPEVPSSMGTFSSHSMAPAGAYGSLFIHWAADPAVRMLSGDFDGDGFDDIMLVGKHCWDLSASQSGPCDENISPVALGGPHGFTATVMTNNYSGGGLNRGFRPDQYSIGTVVGDFNHDGKDDVYALWVEDTNPDVPLDDPGKAFQPWATTASFTSGGPGFEMHAQLNTEIVKATVWPGAKIRAGDFNGDGKDDLAIVGRYNGRSDYEQPLSQGAMMIAVVLTGSGGQTASLIETPVVSPVAPGYGNNQPLEQRLVPTLVGKTEAEATAAIAAAGFVKDIPQYQPNCYLAGKVAASSPEQGRMMPGESAVTLTIHTQPATCVVPALTDSFHEDAVDTLTTHGFDIGTITSRVGTCQNAGSVHSSTPAAGTVLPYGSTVSLTVRRQPPSGCEPV